MLQVLRIIIRNQRLYPDLTVIQFFSFHYTSCQVIGSKFYNNNKQLQLFVFTHLINKL